MDQSISFSDISAASSIDQQEVPSILMSTLSINDSAKLVDAAEVGDAKGGDGGGDDLQQLNLSPSAEKNEYAVLVAMLRAFFQQKRPGVIDNDLFDLIGHSLTSPSSSELLLTVDGDRVDRFLAAVRKEAHAFMAFSAVTANAWKRSLLPSLVGSYEVPYTEERFRLELEGLAAEIRTGLVEPRAELAADRRALAERVALLEGLVAELLDEELTENAALIKEQLILEKAVKKERMRTEELKSNLAQQRPPPAVKEETLEETLEERLRRLTRQNARLTGQRDDLVAVKAVVEEQQVLDPVLVARYQAATQALQFTTDVLRKH
ncbi:hypothetical protein TYRP_021798 [Tyrophagus putrescentiae]|nr:hypothetical protein TYRP_021798 [Tyrophagus putrescentiae]